MNEIAFKNAFDSGLFDEEYMEYIEMNADINICPIFNGDSLIEAFKKGYLFEEFRKSKLYK